ncbi:antA/AntB antirepressor family protein [Chryseobacterium sp. 'Rf worker isolate 10']|uniref:antA/AntB antirepressor family protein n=1 Tax=Chryseobacterium sp. 'Rf worker isolate 10' TaxID=2887348 RepID=UPI003D7017AA
MEIIKILTTENGLQTVSATDLYKFLEPKSQFNHWIKRMLNYGFIEGLDFWSFLTENKLTSKITETDCSSNLNIKRERGRLSKEYVLSLDCAKSIAMVQRSEKGRQIRTYFIEAEKEFRAIATPQQIQELYKRLSILESKQINYIDDWAIDRYLRVNNLFSELSKTDRQQLGKLCTKTHKEKYSMPPKKVPHPSYTDGQNVYPYELINAVFKDWKAKQ